MCGRYGIFGYDKLEDRFDLEYVPPEFLPNYNAAPGQILPVIKQEHSKRFAEPMKWGYIPSWAKDAKIGYKMINTRSETAFEKSTWKKAIKYSRVLIPANGFYEWKKLTDKKQPYFIRPKEEELFGLAGIYSLWKNPVDGKFVSTFSILTTRPNKEMESIHDRMPVILNKETEGMWLDESLEDENVLKEMLQPYPDGSLEMFAVSTDVNVVRNNEQRLIYPVNSA